MTETQKNPEQLSENEGIVTEILQPLIGKMCFLGIFPIRKGRLSWILMIPSLFLLTLLMNNIYKTYYVFMTLYNRNNSDFKATFDLITFIIKPMLDSASAIVFILISIFRAKQTVAYFKAWDEFKDLIEIKKTELKLKIKRIFIIFCGTNLFYLIMILGYNYNYFVNKLPILEYIWLVIQLWGYSTSFLASSFFISFLLSLMHCFASAFEQLSTQLQHLFTENRQEAHTKLENLRRTHFALTQLLSQTSEILSPTLLLQLIVIILNLCSSGYHFLLLLENSNVVSKSYEINFATLTVIMYAVSLLLICSCANDVKQKFNQFADLIYKCETNNLTSIGKYKVLILESEVQKNPIDVNASNLIQFRNSLFIKIAGIVATFVVFMVETRNMN